jgi:uncharacterized OB-fold protein
MSLHRLATYRPAWGDARARELGPDEDVVTLAVEAGLAALHGADGQAPGRIVLVSRTLDTTEGLATGVLALGLGMHRDVPVEVRCGGAPDCLDALAKAGPGTLVIAVDVAEPSSASAAALFGAEIGLYLETTGRSRHSVPMRVRHAGSASTAVYHDPRVERDLASAPIMSELGGGTQAFVAGLLPEEARRVGGAKTTIPTTGAASLLFLLAELADRLADGGTARVVALDAASGIAADIHVDGPVATRRVEREGLPLARRPTLPQGSADIPFSMPAYVRAFDAKIGLAAARCVCGELSYPPRRICLHCGEYDRTVPVPVPLPRTGEVYTVASVNVPVPGVPGPYALAIVALDGVPVRVLAKVTDAPATATEIGDRGRLVLRRIAVREGVPDYGYAFQPQERGTVQ